MAPCRITATQLEITPRNEKLKNYTLFVVPNLQIVEYMENKSLWDNSNGSKILAKVIQTCCHRLFESRFDMSYSCENALHYMAYKPSYLTEETKNFWDMIMHESTRVFTQALSVIEANLEFYGHFTKLYDSTVHFLELDRSGAPPSKSLKWLQDDLEKFGEFATRFEEISNNLTKSTAENLGRIILAMQGVASVTHSVDNVQSYKENYLKKLNDYNKLMDKTTLEILSLQNSYMLEESKYEHAKMEFEYLSGIFNNYNDASKKSQERIDKLRTDLETAQDVVQQKVTSGYWWWWYRYEYYTNVYVGDKTRINNALEEWKSAQRQSQSQIANAKTKKDEWFNIKEEAQRSKVQLYQQLSNKKEQAEKDMALARQELNKANQTLNDALRTIESAIIKTGVQEPLIKDFLQLQFNLIPQTMQNSITSSALKAEIALLKELFQRRINFTIEEDSPLSIDKYLTSPQVNLPNLLPPLQEEGFKYASELIMNKDDCMRLVDLLEIKLNRKLSFREQTIKKLCQQQIEIPKPIPYEFNLFKHQMRPLSLFFDYMEKGLKKASTEVEKLNDIQMAVIGQ